MARNEVISEQIGDGEVFFVDLSSDLQRVIAENETAGWHTILAGETVRNIENKISVVSKFEKQKGFISHKGYIKGGA